MSRFELVCTTSGHAINVGDEVTAYGHTRTVAELEPPEPGFYGCVHLAPTEQRLSPTCPVEAIGAEWHYDGQPYRFDVDLADSEDFDSGRWTQEDTDSMERGRDLPMRNDAGEWMP